MGEKKSRQIEMKNMCIAIMMMSAIMTVAGCGGASSPTGQTFDPRDTVVVPEWFTGEDSIAYIEDAVLQSPFTVKDLLGLAEVHTLEEAMYYYNNTEYAQDNPDDAARIVATPRDVAAVKLGNRFMRMGGLVSNKGNANDKQQWALAVNAALDTLRAAVPSLPADSAVGEIMRVVEKFSSETQMELNYMAYVSAMVEYYRTIETYRQWLHDLPAALKPLAQKEYEAWHELNEARFAFWNDVSYRQEWYSMKPMEIQGYYETLATDRRNELELERGIVLQGKPYVKKGATVSAAQWEKWIADNSVPEDIEILKEMGDKERIPSDSLVAERVKTLKSAFSRWLAARQAFAAALPEDKGKSYDNLTADIHRHMIRKIEE